MRYEVNPQKLNYFSQCQGKKRYVTIEEGYEAFERNVALLGPPSGDMVLYPCPHCDGFHYGRDLASAGPPSEYPPLLRRRDP